jgi:hypothetical protein
MPLCVRLTVLVGLILLVSLAGGGALVSWHAAGRVQIELRAALEHQSVRRNRTGTSATAGTGVPPLVAGANRHFCTAASAAASRLA